MSKIGIVWDNRYLKHDTGPGHPESPARLLAVKEIIDVNPSLIKLAPRLATPEEVGRVHEAALIQSVQEIQKKGRAFFDMDTPVSGASGEAAFLAAGGIINAVDAVEKGECSSAFAFPRPPGHHAEAGQAMGFCLFNNIAIAAEHLLKVGGKKRVAIVDIDVHHGNGTQHSFYGRNDVLFISTHRFPFYPGTGAATERGVGEGEGFTLNVPFHAFAGDDDYEREYEEQILPALDAYRPDFILVSAGFDAHKRDPLGGMNVSGQGFSMMARNLVAQAKKHCGGKIVFALEGGYDMKGLQEGVAAVFDHL